MRLFILLAILMLSTTATAHEVKPPPMKEACDAAKWLGSELAGTPLSAPEYSRLDTMASRAFDECEAYQEPELDKTGGCYALDLVDGEWQRVPTKECFPMGAYVLPVYDEQGVMKCD